VKVGVPVKPDASRVVVKVPELAGVTDADVGVTVSVVDALAVRAKELKSSAEVMATAPNNFRVTFVLLNVR
jgi:hypothetical protein